MTVVTIRETDGTRKRIGEVRGDTLFLGLRKESVHLFRGRAESVAAAIESGTAAWGVDMAALDGLAVTHGIKYVEIPTKTARYRTTVSKIQGPKAYTAEYHNHRPQYFLPLHLWTKVPK